MLSAGGGGGGAVTFRAFYSYYLFLLRWHARKCRYVLLLHCYGVVSLYAV